MTGLPPIPSFPFCPAWRNRRHKIVKCVSPDERDCMSCKVGAKAMENDGKTHWQGCWRHHRECAVAMVERLREKLEHLADSGHWKKQVMLRGAITAADMALFAREALELTKEEK